MLLRPAAPEDAEELAALHLTVWDEAYAGLIEQRVLDERRERPAAEREARWAGRIAAGTTSVACEHGRIVGFVTSGPGRDGDPVLPALEVMALYVLARVYGRGYGHALLQHAIGEQAAYLWVLSGNVRAEAFYRRHRFEYDGAERADTYGTERRMRRTQLTG